MWATIAFFSRSERAAHASPTAQSPARTPFHAPGRGCNLLLQLHHVHARLKRRFLGARSNLGGTPISSRIASIVFPSQPSHPIESECFAVDRLATERKGILAGHASRSSQPIEFSGQTFGPLPSPESTGLRPIRGQNHTDLGPFSAFSAARAIESTGLWRKRVGVEPKL
jgi:hypothetical protein